MPFRIFSIIFISTSLTGLLFSHAVLSKDITFIKDSSGKVTVTDVVHPSEIDKERKIVNKAGNVKEIIPKLPSPEQREHDKRLAILKMEEEKIIARQKKYDATLLKTYHSQADLMMAITVKMKAFETESQVIEGNATRLNQVLATQQKAATKLERNGETVPEKLLADIKSTQKQIQDMQSAINARKEKQNQIKKTDEADIARFLFLTHYHEIKPKVRIASVKEANELGLFYCENDIKCNEAWEVGRKFVNDHSTTPSDVYGQYLIMNRPPATDTDISLSLSKIKLNDNDTQLFLDIHCLESPAGNETCASQRVKDLRESFGPYVNKVLSLTAQH